MSGINKVILVGNVGKEPEIKHLDNGRALTKLSLATSERYKNKAGERVEKTEWHNITFWSPLAEVVEKYVQKGSKLYIEGRIRTRSYDDNEGKKRYITEIEAREMVMLDSRGETKTTYADQGAAADHESHGAPPVADQGDDLPF